MGLSPYDFMEDVNPGYSNTGVVNTSSTGSDMASEQYQIPVFRLLIDWLGFTFKADGIRVEHVLQWFENCLKISRYDWKPGRRFYQGYADSFVFENITIYYNGAEKQGIHVDFSGQGCRYIDTFFKKLQIHEGKKEELKEFHIISNWYDLLATLHYTDDINITRLDIASDDFQGLIDVEKLFHKCLMGELSMKFRSWRPDGKFNSNGKTEGISLYFGSDQSDVQLTIYEKNKQLNLDFHWTRLELQFRRKRAETVVKEIVETEKGIGLIFAGILKYYLTFKEKGADTNKSRWKVSPWWEELFKHVEPLKIAHGLPDKSIVKNHVWINSQVSRTLARLYFANQDINENWLRETIAEGIKKLNEDDLRLIEEYRRDIEKKEPKKIGSFIDI